MARTTKSEQPRRRRWASITQTADHLSKSERTVREMIYDGRLKGYRLGRTVFIDLNEVDDAMVEVSTPSCSERTVTPRSVSSCKVLMMPRMLRPSRSNRQTISVSPSRRYCMHSAKPGRSSRAPDITS